MHSRHFLMALSACLACSSGVGGNESTGFLSVTAGVPGAPGAWTAGADSNSSSGSSGTTQGTTDGETTMDALPTTGGVTTGGVTTGGVTTGALSGATGTTGATSGFGSTGAPDGSTGDPDGSTSDGLESSTGGLPTPDTTATVGPEEAPNGGGEEKPGPQAPPAGATDENLLLALIGDQGTGKDTKAVYKLLLEEQADLVIILGDFDYKDDPDAWDAEMESVLGEDFPVFGVIGNHDKDAWSGYQKKLKARLANIPGASCTGDLGVKSSCNYRGLHFVLSGLGTKGSDSEHEKHIAEALAADDSLWSLCTFHKNQRDLQAGDKPDDLTWKALKACQADGSIIAMAHEHSYARTMTLTDLGNKSAAHGATGLPELLEVGPGSTFSVVSGLGGKSIRDFDAGLHGKEKWWASIYTDNYYLKNGEKISKFEADHGALFIRFHVDGDPKAAHGYFKNIQGEIVDEFDIVHK